MKIKNIFEVRRNPEINKKISAFEQLKKYAGQKDIFVTFTHDVGKDSHKNADKKMRILGDTNVNISGAKIGINPDSQHKTPNGIYTYPIDHVLSSNLKVEYGNDRPYIWVLRLKQNDNVLDLQNYSVQDFKKDYDKILQLFPKSAFKELFDPEKGIERRKFYIWNITRNLSKVNDVVNPNIWAAIFRKIGYNGVIDNGYGIIHRNEPTQAVFFSRNSLEIVELVRNSNLYKNTLVKLFELTSDLKISPYNIKIIKNIEKIISNISDEALIEIHKEIPRSLIDRLTAIDSSLISQDAINRFIGSNVQ